MLRTGPKGSGEFRRIGWDEALDRVAAGFADVAARHGGEAVWPYSSAGTMGLVHRDGIFRLRHAMRWSGRKGTICSAIATAEIAAQAGVTERTFFRHFTDKREALFDGEEAFRDALAEAVVSPER